MSDSTPGAAPRHPSRAILAYVLPTVAAGTAVAPVTAILPSLYAKYTHVTLAALGTLFVVLRIVDAVSDPLVGYWSDRTRSVRFGRKPWVIAGALVCSISVWFLFRIPPAAGIAYLATWSLLFYFGYTVHEVPHMAWGSEITDDYEQRAKLFSFRSMADTTGGFIYTLLPPILFYLGIAHSTDYTPDVFRHLGFAVLLLFPLMIAIAARYAPAGDVPATSHGDLRGLLSSTLRNPPLLRFLAAYLVAGAGTGVFAALFFPYFDSYLHIGDKVAYLLLTAMIAQFISQPFWAKVVSLIGKHRCWAYGWIANSLVLVPMVFIKPGPGAVWPVMISVAFYSFTNGVSTVAPMGAAGRCGRLRNHEERRRPRRQLLRLHAVPRQDDRIGGRTRLCISWGGVRLQDRGRGGQHGIRQSRHAHRLLRCAEFLPDAGHPLHLEFSH